MFFKEHHDTLKKWSAQLYRWANTNDFQILTLQVGPNIIINKTNGHINYNRFRGNEIEQIPLIELPLDSLSREHLELFQNHQEEFDVPKLNNILSDF